MNKEIQTNSTRELLYEPFEKYLDKAISILDNNPSYWWMGTTLLLRRIKRDLEKDPLTFSKEALGYIFEYVNDIEQILIEETNKEKSIGGEALSQKTQDVIHGISHLIMSKDQEIESQTQFNTISLNELVKMSPRFKIVEGESGTQVFQIHSISRNIWFDFPIPSSPNLIHKGGFSRVVLKIIAGAPEEIIEKELPPNDLDVIAVGDRDFAVLEALKIGVQGNGVEMADDFDYPKLIDNRDLDINGCFIGTDGFIFSNEAFRAARSGKITVKSTKRGIYGTEVFYYESLRMLKQRGIMRLAKTIVDGKAISFDFTPLNQKVDLGIYWLVLIRKYMEKPDFPLLAQKLYFLGTKIGQVLENENDIFDILNRVHEKYSFFDFSSNEMDEAGVARWLGKKLSNQLDKQFREYHKIPSSLILERSAKDTDPIEVGITDFIENRDESALFMTKWKQFLSDCKKRNALYEQTKQQ